MHEVGIMESALRAALAEMEKRGAGRILSLTLRIGELAAVDPEALRFAFDAVTPATPMEGAELKVESVAPLAWCRSCDKGFRPSGGHLMQCPECGNYTAELRQGREIELARLELQS